MSDSQEKSDDLIAELAKLMASNAGGSAEGAKPTVIKLPPLNEATVKANPVRIPGMEAPRPAAEASRPAPSVQPATPAPTIRIPGMEKPAGIDTPPPPKPAAQFDFGKPLSPAPVFKPEPMSNWQTREPPRLSPEPPPTPAAVAHLAELKFDPVKPADPQAAPSPSGQSRPAAAAPVPRTAEAPPAQASEKPGTSDSFGFDFGFGKGSHAQPQTPPAPANDPIADLISAELDAGEPAKLAPTPPSAPAGDVLPNPIPPRPAAQPTARPAAASASPIRPVSVTPRTVEGDRFTIAPILGGQKPAAAPPLARSEPPAPLGKEAALDPIEEIENLIGEAVRVELEVADKPPAAMAPEPAAKPAAPVVPPLGSAFGPRRANMREKEPPIESAEAAILAAAAASGAEVDRVEAPADERPYKRMKVKPPRTSFISSGARQYVGIAVAGTLLLAAGFGLYWVLGMGGRDDPATAPVLTADAGPVKVEPTVADTNTAEPSGSVVFDEINGNTAIDDGETLVSRDETAGASPTEVARAVTPAVEETGETGLANRKVRTVTVRPDGTIVSGDEAVAGTEALPVARPNVPDLPGEDLEPSDLLTAAVAETRGPAATAGDAAPTGSPAATTDPISALVSETGDASATPLPEPEPLDVAAVEPSDATPAVFDAGLVAPIPMPRPADRARMVGGTAAVREANTDGALAPAQLPLVDLTDETPATTSAISSRGGAYVQLSSQKTEADAQASLRATQNRMSGVLNGASLEIRRVDLGAKGVWYRVVLPRESFQDATQTCAAIKSNGWDCVAIGG
ncbi:MAG TPA: hypothetical protein GYA10_02500 [Alphaproteobacteria bacterium]|nr:hypothetical protein [Alphaproteobacteria bacterium]